MPTTTRTSWDARTHGRSSDEHYPDIAMGTCGINEGNRRGNNKRTDSHTFPEGVPPQTLFGKPIPKRTRTDEERTKTTHDAPDPRDHRDGPVHHLLRLLHHDHHLVTDRPAGHVHQPAYRSRMRHHGDNPRPHPPHDNLHDHHPNERKGKTWERQSCNRR